MKKYFLSVNKKYMSEAKFSKGQTVYYNEEFRNKLLADRNKLLERLSSRELGEMPTGKLLIDDHPVRCEKTGTWMYRYVYGFCGHHEGYAKESDLVSKEEFYRT